MLYSHCVICSGVILQIVEGFLDWPRHGVNSTDVLLVEKRAGMLVLRGIQFPSSISFLKDLPYICWKIGTQTLAPLDEKRETGGRSGNDQFDQSSWASRSKHSGKHATPALAEKVKASVAELQVVNEVIELSDE